MPRRPWDRGSRGRSGGASAEQLAWSTIDDAVRLGVVPDALVQHVRSTGEFTLVQLLEYAAQEALERRDDGMAQRLYEAAAEQGSANAGVAYNLGNIAVRAGRVRDAVRYYDAAIALDPDLALAYYNRGVQRRRSGDERGARADIATAIEKGYDGLAAYAALLRGREREFGPPVDALARAVVVQQALAAGDVESATTLAHLESEVRRRKASEGLGHRLALVVALECEWDLARRLGDVHGAVELGEELLGLCRVLAALDVRSWSATDAPMRPFAVDQLPRRLVAMVEAYVAAGRHDAALTTAAAAIDWAGGPESANPQVGAASASIADAVYAEMRRRAERGDAG